MIDRYRTLDVVKIGAQTHAMLSAANGILRWYELERRPEDLAFAEFLYKQYRDLAMTETYENDNWFNRPQWTEACAVVDSFILAVNLWRTTGKAAYLEDAHLILFNGLLPGQTPEGGFGTGPCTVVELAFDQASGPRPALHPDRSPGAVRYFQGPLLMGSDATHGSGPLTPLLDILDPLKGRGGEPYVFFPQSGAASNASRVPAAMDDRAPLAHLFRHGMPAGTVPREFAPLFTAASFDWSMVLCGLVWDRPQHVRQVVVQWPEDGAMPAADDVLVQWSASDGIHTARSPGIIGNGRQWVYRVAGNGDAVQLSNVVLCLRSCSGTPSGFAVPDVQVPATAP